MEPLLETASFPKTELVYHPITAQEDDLGTRMLEIKRKLDEYEMELVEALRREGVLVVRTEPGYGFVGNTIDILQKKGIANTVVCVSAQTIIDKHEAHDIIKNIPGRIGDKQTVAIIDDITRTHASIMETLIDAIGKRWEGVRFIIGIY